MACRRALVGAQAFCGEKKPRGWKSGFEIAGTFLQNVTSSRNVHVGNVEVTFDISSFLDAKKKMSFTDIALVSLAKITGYRLITFDKEMLRLFNSKI